MRALTTGLILSATLALSACSTISSVTSSMTDKVKGLFGGSSSAQAQTVPASTAMPSDAAATAAPAPALQQGGQRGPMDIDPAHPFAR